MKSEFFINIKIHTSKAFFLLYTVDSEVFVIKFKMPTIVGILKFMTNYFIKFGK